MLSMCSFGNGYILQTVVANEIVKGITSCDHVCGHFTFFMGEKWHENPTWQTGKSIKENTIFGKVNNKRILE